MAWTNQPNRRPNTRQRNVLQLVTKGLRNSEIGEQLGISERSVKSYLSQLFLIFDVTNRTELVGVVLTETALGTHARSFSNHTP